MVLNECCSVPRTGTALALADVWKAAARVYLDSSTRFASRMRYEECVAHAHVKRTQQTHALCVDRTHTSDCAHARAPTPAASLSHSCCCIMPRHRCSTALAHVQCIAHCCEARDVRQRSSLHGFLTCLALVFCLVLLVYHMHSSPVWHS